ncbi:hypothetical protein [Natronococcus pandeyae]|uniref:hypothetical protein n=1 Tax=Natronococcus pandeyae TaxID=2055836 RepID=UPI0011E6BC89|nr:hypothetical protein [Natronococcus pandeyae]
MQQTIAKTIRDVAEGHSFSPEFLDGTRAPVERAERSSRLDDEARTTHTGTCFALGTSEGLVVICPENVLPSAVRGTPSILSKSEFATSVQRLVHSACRNDVDVRGSWPFRTEADLPDFELEILEVEKPV